MNRFKKYKLSNYINSIRIQVFAIIFLVMIIPVVVCNLVIVEIVDSNYISQKNDKLQIQNTMLKNCIISENYVDTVESAIVSAETNRVASGYDGRIQIINSNYEVLSDTYATDIGKTCISERVMEAMSGESVSDYNEDESYMEYAVPIQITSSIESQDANSPTKTVTIGVLYVRYSTKDVDKFKKSVVSFTSILDLIVLAFAVLLSFLISKYIAAPFKNAENELERITNGDTTAQINLKGYTEVKQIGDAVEHLLAKLSTQEKSRQEFVSNVSHELKTPITSMKVLADSLIGQQNVPEELYQEFLTDIGKEIDRENDIITDLLSLVRMDKDKAELNIGQYNINDIVELTLKRLRPIAAAKNIELVFESFRPVLADVDDVKITIVFSNLVENAIKYNVNDGWVRVSLNADHQYFYLNVSDSGIGIDEEDQDKIFDRFFRVDKARSRETGGTGLGLAITRRIVLMHNGAIKVHSKENEGTTFTVRIPLKYIV